MRTRASFKVAQRFEISSHPTSLMEMIEERSFRAKELFWQNVKSWQNQGKLDQEVTLEIIFIITFILLWENWRPKQLRDSLKVLHSWLGTSSELELHNPDSISVVLQLDNKFENPYLNPSPQNYPMSSSSCSFLWKLSKQAGIFWKENTAHKVGGNSCTDLLTESKYLASPRQRRVLVLRLELKTSCVTRLREGKLFWK